MTDSRFDLLDLGEDLNTHEQAKLDVFHMLVTGQTNLSGKCLSGDDWIVTRAGELLTVSEVYSKNLRPDVFSVNDQSLKIEVDKIIDIQANGIKPIFKVLFSDGRWIKLTANHPIFTIYGWKKIEELHEGIFVGLPRVIPIECEGQEELPEAAKLIGYMISEGTMNARMNFTFTNSNREIVNDMEKSLEKFGLELHQVSSLDYKIRQRSKFDRPYKRAGSGNQTYGYLRKFVEDYGLKPTSSRNKEIPRRLMRSDKRTLRHLLMALFDGDGWIDQRGIIGYGTISETLVRQIQHLLLRFGIKSSVRVRDSSMRRNYRSFELNVLYEDSDVFLEKIGCPKNNTVLTRRIPRYSHDNIPIPIPRFTNRGSNGSKKRESYNDNPSRKDILVYGLARKDEALVRLAQSDLVWRRIKSIQGVGEEMTYDVQVQNNHNLVVNDVIVHNTTTLKKLIPEALEKGYTVLVFDSKTIRREWEGVGHDIPLCYKPTTDALVLIGLLESIFKRKITNFYATLSRITTGAEDIPAIIKKADELEKESKVGFIRDACHTLKDLLTRLQKDLSRIDLSEKLELEKNVLNVMPINFVSPETQQLVIKTACEEILEHYNRKVIIVIDEAFKFLPQEYSSACKRPIQDVITQGAGTKLFVWLATQFISPTDKDAMKACAVKLLGREDDDTEIEATQKRAPGGKKAWTRDKIMTLQPGQFIYVPINEATRIIYVTLHGAVFEHVQQLARAKEEEDWTEEWELAHNARMRIQE